MVGGREGRWKHLKRTARSYKDESEVSVILWEGRRGAEGDSKQTEDVRLDLFGLLRGESRRDLGQFCGTAIRIFIVSGFFSEAVEISEEMLTSFLL